MIPAAEGDKKQRNITECTCKQWQMVVHRAAGYALGLLSYAHSRWTSPLVASAAKCKYNHVVKASSQCLSR